MKKFEFEADFSLLQAHRRLARFNRSRLDPRVLSPGGGGSELENEYLMALLEDRILEAERLEVAARASLAPVEKKEFLEWFTDLKRMGPGQNSALFDWLAENADLKRMRWFVFQEQASEAGFDDLTAMTQLKFPAQAKLEMARNFWDEMGRGRQSAMHGPMLKRLCEELELEQMECELEAEPLALANVMMGLALNRRYAYHAVGALGVIELTAPARAEKVWRGLKRLGVSREGQRYYQLHSTIDVKHSEEWNKNVIAPLVEEGGAPVARAIAEGALMRLNAGARCFARYKAHFGFVN